jgi:hypothetical protein
MILAKERTRPGVASLAGKSMEAERWRPPNAVSMIKEKMMGIHAHRSRWWSTLYPQNETNIDTTAMMTIPTLTVETLMS